MSALQIATVTMSVASIAISGLSIYWSTQTRRARQEVAWIRAERETR